MGEIRIIGGQWRSRNLNVPDLPGLRPTPNQARETLFNWLAQIIPGAYCLDPFAGSGALGFEALSRGAAHLVMVDRSQTVIESLQATCTHLQAKNAEVYRALAPHGLKHPTHLFDMVFLDPPYQDNILLPTCFFLEEQGFLSRPAYIYLESNHTLQESDLPLGWTLLKLKRAGEVGYHLAIRR